MFVMHLAALGVAAIVSLAALPQGDPAARATILELEKMWDRAYESRRTDELAPALAEDYVHTDASGARLTKAEYLKSIVRVPDISRVKSWSSDKVEVTVSGASAVVTGESEVKGRSRGRGYMLEARYHFTDRWARRDGRWVAVSTTARRIEK